MTKSHSSVLIAEDNIDELNIFRDFLSGYFASIYIAFDGEQALKIYKEKKPKIIFTDISMPKIDGLTLIEEIRKNDKKTKIVVISAYYDQEKLFRAIKLNLTDYLVKPLGGKIKEVIHNIIEEENKVKNYLWCSLTETFYIEKQRIKLTSTETKLMKLLFSQPNSFFTKEDIHNFVYENSFEKELSNDSIKSLIKRVKQKLPKGLIQNSYGYGYKVVHDEATLYD
ncbi:MAG: response regulator [Campylobacterales bacterium]|nr:response regulator [Campylobacterales bacterium]